MTIQLPVVLFVAFLNVFPQATPTNGLLKARVHLSSFSTMSWCFRAAQRRPPPTSDGVAHRCTYSNKGGLASFVLRSHVFGAPIEQKMPAIHLLKARAIKGAKTTGRATQSPHAFVGPLAPPAAAGPSIHLLGIAGGRRARASSPPRWLLPARHAASRARQSCWPRPLHPSWVF
ncbi:hypothetical protein HDK77DRAFT_442560 [Phyllosticta capitalensis]